MDRLSTDWKINQRGNLRLWPEVTPSVRYLATCDGRLYDEGALLATQPMDAGKEKAPRTTRNIRQTFELMANCGLAYKDSVPPRLLLTSLGQCVFSFLGVIGGRNYANEHNLPILGRPLARALSHHIECRAIWGLMRACGNELSNEELNRAMKAVASLDDIPNAAGLILNSREHEDPSLIGERMYEQEKFGGPNSEDQRKAMNPMFLLAGGGGVLIELQGEKGRRLRDWAIPLVDQAMGVPLPQNPEGSLRFHADTEKEVVLRLSAFSCVPRDVR